MEMNRRTNRRLLVHLGCGPDVQPTEWIDCDGSWNVLTAKLPAPIRTVIVRAGQFRSWPQHVRFLNLRKPFPFDDNSVDAIYASHVWEHLTRSDAEKATLEAFRVLRRGAVLRVAVPDLHFFCESYVGSHNENAAEILMEQLHLRDRGGKKSLLRKLYTGMTDFHSHKWMYDARSLSNLLRSVGFSGVRERMCFDSDIPEIRQVEHTGRVSKGLGIAVEGIKPL